MKPFKRSVALLSLVSVVLAPLAANADHANPPPPPSNPGYGYGYVRPVQVLFDRLEAHVEDGDLIVSYKLQKASFRFLKREGLAVALRVEAGRQRFESRLEGREGELEYRIDLRRHVPSEVLVSVSGGSARFRIDSLAVDGRAGARLPIRVVVHEREHCEWGHETPEPGPGYPPPARRWSFEPAVIHACGWAMDGQYNERQCLAIVDGFAFDPVATIETCERTMDGDGNELACLQTAARARTDHSRQLMACEVAMDGDGNELACFAKAVTARFDPAPTIEACEIAFDGDGNELACMDATFRFAWNPVPIIQACERSMDGDPAELACLARY